jgi:hypothetical protein
VSSDPSIAEVRQIGEQTAIVVGKKVGSCSVTGTVGGQKTSCAITVTASTLPEGWSYDELNTPPIPGSVLVSGGKFKLTGSGHAITSWWERVRDQGVFASKAVEGRRSVDRATHGVGSSRRREDLPRGQSAADSFGINDQSVT